MIDEEISHFCKHGHEIIIPAQVMRGLGAAIQNDPKGGNGFPEMLKQRPGRVWPCARQGASREEHRIAAFGKSVIGITLRGSTLFIGKNCLMFREILVTAPDRLATQFQKHVGRMYVHGTHCRAKLTQTAFKCHPLMVFVAGIITISDVLWLSIFLQKSAFLFAELATDALV